MITEPELAGICTVEILLELNNSGALLSQISVLGYVMLNGTIISFCFLLVIGW